MERPMPQAVARIGPRRLVRSYRLMPSAYADFAGGTRLSFAGSNARANYFSKGRGMSAVGHKRTFRNVRPMSALPPKADMDQRARDVPFVP
jgi:hypothetical protein